MLGSARGYPRYSGRVSLTAVLTTLAATTALNATYDPPFILFPSGVPHDVIEYRIPILVALGDGRALLAFAVRLPGPRTFPSHSFLSHLQN